MNYYIAQDGKPNGPYTPNELAQRGITPDTLLWNESMTQWTPAGQIPELAYMFNTSAYSGSTYQTPPPPTSNGGYYQQSSYRSQPMPECPKTWLAQSILATLFCCLPFGVVGITQRQLAPNTTPATMKAPTRLHRMPESGLRSPSSSV